VGLKEWNNDIKHLREVILRSEYIEESRELFLKLHAMVHCAEMSGADYKTFEDELWENLEEKVFRTATNEKGRTIAYGIWHSSRIEDITMNILVADKVQVFDEGMWKEKINTRIIDTGNTLNGEEILEFSRDLDIQELRNYRLAVGRNTRRIIDGLTSEAMKMKFPKERLRRILEQGAVLDVEASNWLIDFWGKKNVAGILLMPATRHHVVHINESLSAKKRGEKIK
jgi:hypothetical protein